MKPIISLVPNRYLISWLCLSLVAFFLSSCSRQQRSAQVIPVLSILRVSASTPALVNINIASRDELEQLPGIGPALAMRIIEHRQRYGRFRRAEHLIMVRGLSDRKFRVLRPFAVVE